MTVEQHGTGLVAVARNLASQALEHPAIVRAKSIAHALRGIVVVDREMAARVDDQLGVIATGRKAAKAALDGVLTPYKEAADEARRVFAEITGPLTEAEASAKSALDTFLREEERLQKLEQARLAREAEESAQKAREAERRRLEQELAIAQNQGDEQRVTEVALEIVDVDEIPALDPVPAPAPPRQVRGTNGMTTVRHDLVVEVLDVHEVANYSPALLKLVEADAKALYRAAVIGAEIEDATPERAAVWHGMRFSMRRTMVKR